MAEATAPEVVEPNSTADMDVENVESNQKRAREEEESQEDNVNVNDGVSKKQKVEEELNEEEEEEEKEEEKKPSPSGPVKLGPKSFESSLEMFHYFYNFLHAWPHFLNVNKYEHMMLLELLKNGHTEPGEKIGGGIHAFQVRKHPMWKSRCFFLIREDGSIDDFSFRKCVDHILPLPEEMQLKPDVNKALGGFGGGKRHGGKSGGGRGGGRGHGKGGRSRH